MAGRRAAIILAILLLNIVGCTTENNRLQRLVTNCLDISGETYCGSCQWPRTDSRCVEDNACTGTTEIWRENFHYVAIRDRKMCGCTVPGFVHGLAIPRAIISGVDAANRPNGIWSFAWQSALERNIQPSEIALAINPKHDRSENQMHIHMTRLRSDARSSFAPEMSARVKDLASVWGVAGKIAAAKGLSDYGVLVTAGNDGDFTVVVDEDSPEDRFMLARCPRR